MMRTAPFWLRDVLRPLHFFFQPLYKGLVSQRYQNFDIFMKEGASLACLVNLSDTMYEDLEVDFPAHVLEWDMAGSVNVSADNELFLKAGEIKSSQQCKSSLDTNPLKQPTLTHSSIRTRKMATGATDEIAFSSPPDHHAKH